LFLQIRKSVLASWWQRYFITTLKTATEYLQRHVLFP